MLCCCRQKLDITDTDPATSKPSSDSDKEKVFSEAVTAHPSPAATPVIQQPPTHTANNGKAATTTTPTDVNNAVANALRTSTKSPESAVQAAPPPQTRPAVVEETLNQSAAKPASAAPTPTPKANVSVVNVSASSGIPSKEAVVDKAESVATAATGTVAAATTTAAAAKDSAVLGQIDALSQAVETQAAAGRLKGREACGVLASQLSVLTSQVRSQAGIMSESTLQSAVSRLEAVASRLEGLAVGSKGGAADGDSGVVAPFVLAFDDFLGGSYAKFMTLSGQIGGDVKTQVDIVNQAFQAQRQFLVAASKSKEPAQDALVKAVGPVGEKITAVQDFREKNRGSQVFNNLSAVSESIAALGWITVPKTPCPYIKEMKDAGMFFANRVIKDFKDKDQVHVDWTRAWMAALTELQDYVKDHHRTGVSWNAQGGNIAAVSGSAPPPPPAGGPPAPPPPPPPGPPPPASASSSGGDDGRAQLFADLSKGFDVTKGLKKVTDDQKTHKNPALRQGPAPFKAAKPVAAPKPAVAAKANAAKKPALTELQAKKWIVEYHDNNKNIVLDQTEHKQTVYVYKCTNCTVQVKGKINSIVMDSCKKTAIVFDDAVSSLEFVNCQSMQGQITGKCPTISIDKTDGCMVYLSEHSLETEIVTAKSSEMNILVPVAGGDYKEFALPEQFKTTWNGKSMVTVQMDSI